MNYRRIELNQTLFAMHLHGQEWGYIEDPTQEMLDALKPIDGIDREIPCPDSPLGQIPIQEVRPQWRNGRGPQDPPSRLRIRYHT